ncbi:hypothetical protein BHU72_04495 [Desulfuribacillus stibiiarsenatis]|uniref:Ppx/GppA phosphatase C-terminal domain-containing protein n=1 Tax=Desulfuribacillus stibiiarsenatis TaxID=1390249 RepID=A0A1E5L5D8_9FIRM|nr:HD domain-containing protein [Desulfuribacillus stibiiarsenatis]OEH85357.1 hypothetical protein BHU72_04495 [Desulfuribacillus stibiiarsenatis]
MLDIRKYLPEDQLALVFKKYEVAFDESHEQRVHSYATSLFHALIQDKQWADEKLALLQYCAYLHDIGHFIHENKHDKHTKYLIAHDHVFDCVPDRLRSMLAIIAGGHRKSISNKIREHTKDEQYIILQLAGILRIADAIDYTRESNIRIEDMYMDNHQFCIHLCGYPSPTVIKRISEKSALFREIFQSEIRVVF